MSPLFLLALLLIDLPAFVYFKRRFFPTSESVQQALQWSHPPELSYHLLHQEWRQAAAYLRLPAFTAACGSVLLMQYLVIQAVNLI